MSEIESKKTRRKKREREAASALKPFVELVFIFVLQVKQDLWFNKEGNRQKHPKKWSAVVQIVRLRDIVTLCDPAVFL